MGKQENEIAPDTAVNDYKIWKMMTEVYRTAIGGGCVNMRNQRSKVQAKNIKNASLLRRKSTSKNLPA